MAHQDTWCSQLDTFITILHPHWRLLSRPIKMGVLYGTCLDRPTWQAIKTGTENNTYLDGLTWWAVKSDNQDGCIYHSEKMREHKLTVRMPCQSPTSRLKSNTHTITSPTHHTARFNNVTELSLWSGDGNQMQQWRFIFCAFNLTVWFAFSSRQLLFQLVSAFCK